MLPVSSTTRIIYLFFLLKRSCRNYWCGDRCGTCIPVHRRGSERSQNRSFRGLKSTRWELEMLHCSFTLMPGISGGPQEQLRKKHLHLGPPTFTPLPVTLVTGDSCKMYLSPCKRHLPSVVYENAGFYLSEGSPEKSHIRQTLFLFIKHKTNTRICNSRALLLTSISLIKI